MVLVSTFNLLWKSRACMAGARVCKTNGVYKRYMPVCGDPLLSTPILETPLPFIPGEGEVDQRGLIYTEHKPLGRLYKMCYPFFHEFRVIPSANEFQLVYNTATVVNSPQRLYVTVLTLIGVLLTLAGIEGQWAMIFFIEGCELQNSLL
jgi:hypothetical protein